MYVLSKETWMEAGLTSVSLAIVSLAQNLVFPWKVLSIHVFAKNV